MNDLEILKLLESPRAMMILYLTAQKDRYSGEFNRDGKNPDGLGSQTTVAKANEILCDLNLLEEYSEGPSPPFKKMFRVTPKGSEVLELLRKILQLIKS